MDQCDRLCRAGHNADAAAGALLVVDLWNRCTADARAQADRRRYANIDADATDCVVECQAGFADARHEPPGLLGRTRFRLAFGQHTAQELASSNHQ